MEPNIVNLGDFDPAKKEADKRKHIMIPLHLDPKDDSGEANLKRFDLYMNLRTTYGPRGFKQLRTSKHQLIKNPKDRMYWITKKASAYLEEQKKIAQPKGELSFDTDVKVPEVAGGG